MRLGLIVFALVLFAVGVFLVRRGTAEPLPLKKWAEDNGFTYVGTCEEFPGKQVSRGIVGGYEAFSGIRDGVPVCAVRRDESVDKPVELDGSFPDARVTETLASLPETVTRAYLTGEWVVIEGSATAFPQLTQLADAAYALPPAGGYRELALVGMDPTRPLRTRRLDSSEPEPLPQGPAVELPQRAVGTRLGETGEHVVAADEVQPIGDENVPTKPSATGTGARPAQATRQMEPSSIFDDKLDS